MIIVAICDDDKRLAAELECALVDVFDKLQIKYEIDVYFTGEELCRKLEAGAVYDLIFLDIEFAKGELDGVEVGRLIRDTYQNNMVSIVYISWQKNYAFQLFEVHPLNFLVKPLEHDKIDNVKKKYLKIAGLWSEVFVYKFGHDAFKVQVKDIVYLESAKRKVVLHLSDGRKEAFYGTLKEAYREQLQKFDFIPIHAAFIVNYDYLDVLRHNELFLTGINMPLPISQHRRKEVKEIYYTITEKRRV